MVHDARVHARILTSRRTYHSALVQKYEARHSPASARLGVAGRDGLSVVKGAEEGWVAAQARDKWRVRLRG